MSDGVERGRAPGEVVGVLAGDAEREAVRLRLVTAYAEGRLGAEELDARATRLYGPLTVGEAYALVRDLPGPSGGPPPPTCPVAWLAVTVHDLLVLVVAGGLAVVLWVLLGRGFFWPVWVLVYAGIPVVLDLARARREVPSTSSQDTTAWFGGPVRTQRGGAHVARR